jgi:hypothetical protein
MKSWKYSKFGVVGGALITYTTRGLPACFRRIYSGYCSFAGGEIKGIKPIDKIDNKE